MKHIVRHYVPTVILIVVFLAVCTNTATKNINTTSPHDPSLTNNIMKLTSTSFGNNTSIPSQYTCDDVNISPPLSWSEVPIGTQSFALIVDDPDAPVGNWVHWIMWNISADTMNIAENSVPQGAVEGTTDFGIPGYGGPCPPSGTHRYFFKLYALDVPLTLDSAAKKQDLESALASHVLGKAELIGLYQKM